MKNINRLLTAVLIISVIGIVFLASTNKVNDIYTITFEAVLQLLVVSILGHVVSLLINQMNYEREEIKAKDEFRKRVLTKLTESFFDVKKNRRLIRAKNTSEEGGYPKSITENSYNIYMEILNEIQLRLEGVSKEIENNQALFYDYERLQKNIDSLEEYLNKIVNEYEHGNPRIDGESTKIDLEDIPMFNDLVQSYRKSSFRTDFIIRYYIAADIIRGTLLYSGENKSRKRPDFPVEGI